MTAERGRFRQRKRSPGGPDLLSRSESVVNRMRDLGDRKNHVKIGIPPMIGSFLFPVIFQEFSKLHPEIRPPQRRNDSSIIWCW